MSIELKVPEVGESIREVQVGAWMHAEGDWVKADEGLVELETDKASLELPAPKSGVLVKIIKQEGESVSIGEVLGHFEEGEKPADDETSGNAAADDETLPTSSPNAASANGKQSTGTTKLAAEQEKPDAESGGSPPATFATPSARRELRKHDLEAGDLKVSGPRIRKEDVQDWIAEQRGAQSTQAGAQDEGAEEELVKMSPIRKSIAERLVQAQHQSALLTTFNELDMSAVKQLRKSHGERFQEQHGVKLGYMSFFVKALVDALKTCPELNAEIRGDQIAYRKYHHIGVAIGSKKGLVVPVIRHAERLSFAEVERTINDFATRANAGKLSPGELTGGTFTVSNGGVYGSLLSTPIVNPPQSGVLGMHAIEDRPIARNGEVVIRPMMYVALTYDHRIVDGRESVTFLRRVKESIEDPARMLIEA